MNPRLYSYISSFKDFFPDANGYIKKRIILKVSDYRSSLIQGKFLAKKGLWVSEYRIESGLNCGGHAFASDGFLMGPILDQFKEKRQELVDAIHSVVSGALESAKKYVPALPMPVKITAQGGVGTAEEHNFYGGLGESVSRVLAQNAPTPQEFVAVNDSFGESGTPDQLMEKYGLNDAAIVAAAKKAISRK
jgi:hypothetical protein